MGQLFNILLYQPLLNFLILIYNYLPWHDLGLAIIVLTVFIRLLLIPISWKSIVAQQKMQELQPEMDEIKKKDKKDKAKEAQALMDFYKKNKINPFSSCLPLLIQFPFFIALFRVFRTGLSGDDISGSLYAFVADPGIINSNFLGILDLSRPNYVLAFIAAGLQFWQSKMMTTGKKRDDNKQVIKKNPKEEFSYKQEFAQSLNTQMTYMMPLLTFWFAVSFPSGLALYWTCGIIFAIIQQYVVIKRKS